MTVPVDSLSLVRAWFQRAFIYVLLLGSAAFFLAPFWVMLVTSLKPLDQLSVSSIFAWPAHPSIRAWATAWSGACNGLICSGVAGGFVNSVAILVPSLVLSILIGSLSGYSLTFFPSASTRSLSAILVLCAFLPYQVFTYPLVRLFSVLGIYDTLLCIILVHSVLGLPLTTLLFRGYFAEIPADIVRAAQIDGAGYWTTYTRVVAPAALPAFAVVAILQATGIWNDFYFGLVFAGPDNLPMTVQLNNIVNTTTGYRDYPVDMAATLLTSLVPLTICVLSGKWFVRALTAGAVKG